MIQEFRVSSHRLLFDLQPEEFVSDHNLLWYAQNHDIPEPEVIRLMLRAVNPGDCVIDAGANVGFFTVLMSKLVGDRGCVLAIEPDRTNVAKLRKNLDINSCANVQIYDCLLAEGAGIAPLYANGGDNGQIHAFGDGEPLDMVGCETFDTILKSDCRPSFLKLDIEGSEVAALLGARSYAFPLIVAEINDAALKRAGHSARDLFTLLRERGYKRYQLHNDGSMPSHIADYQDVVLRRANTNMLFAFRDHVPKLLWPEVEV